MNEPLRRKELALAFHSVTNCVRIKLGVCFSPLLLLAERRALRVGIGINSVVGGGS